MPDMIVTDLVGNSEIVTDFKRLQRKRKVNGEHSISYFLLSTERNAVSYPMVKEESFIEYDGQKYIIKKVERSSSSKVQVKQVYAIHYIFGMIDNMVYAKTSGVKTIQQALDFALAGSGITYSVVDAFNTQDVGEFGGDNSISLLNKICEIFGAEIDEDNNHLTVRSQIGVDAGAQIRRGYNLKTIKENVETNNLSTYIKGYGKQNEDGTYSVEAEYISPNASLFPSTTVDGYRHAPPIYDDRYTTAEGLLERLQKDLQDTPDASITVSFSELRKAGYPYEVINKGDTIYVIDDILGVDYPVRVMEVDDYPEDDDPSETIVVLENRKRKGTDYQSNFEIIRKQLRDVINRDGKVRYNVLDEAVKVATEAIKNATTELTFPDSGGIHAIDKTDPNKLTVYTSKGFGISRDGGNTFQEAITADGFVLSVGAIGELSANNIDVTGVILAINDEGTTLIDGGKIALSTNSEFAQLNLDVEQAKTDASSALNEANETGNVVDLWKYPNTTYIDGGQLFTDTVTANAINVTTLSAITANLGTVTAGSITANTTVDVGTNMSIGQKLTIKYNASVTSQILFPNSFGEERWKIYKSPSSESLVVEGLQVSLQAASVSPGQAYINGYEVLISATSLTTISGNLNVTGYLRKNGVDVSLSGHTHSQYALTSHDHHGTYCRVTGSNDVWFQITDANNINVYKNGSYIRTI